MDTATNEKAIAGSTENDVTAVADATTGPTASATTPSNEERAKQEEQWRADLARLEYEIQTLRNVLIAKMDEAGELKKKLGITTIVELKQDLKQGIQAIKESDTVKKTNAALKSVGDYASKKMGDIRNSNTFKSMEEKVGVAYSNVRKRVSVSKSDDNPDGLTSPQEPTSPAFESPTVDADEELANMLPETDKLSKPASLPDKRAN